MKRTLCISLLLCGSLGQTHVANGAEFTGTLFTSPEQREYLDYLRREFLARSAERGFDIDEAEIPEIPTDAPDSLVAPTRHSLGAIITQRDGTHRLWLDGKSLHEAELPAGMQLVHEGNTVALHITAGGSSHLLRPGQTLDLATGSIVETRVLQAAAAEAAAAEEAAAKAAAESKDDATTLASTVVETLSAVTGADAAATTPDAAAATEPELSVEQFQTLLQTLESLQGVGGGDGDD